MPTANDYKWMQQAMGLAKEAAQASEVPVGAILVRDGLIIGEGSNSPISSFDPTAHAEIKAIRQAAQKEANYRLPGTTLYVTIEPCSMCLGAIVHARISRVVFGAREPKAGVLASNSLFRDAVIFNHAFDWEGGVCEKECSELMQSFFLERRIRKKELKKNK